MTDATAQGTSPLDTLIIGAGPSGLVTPTSTEGSSL